MKGVNWYVAGAWNLEVCRGDGRREWSGSCKKTRRTFTLLLDLAREQTVTENFLGSRVFRGDCGLLRAATGEEEVQDVQDCVTTA